MEAPPTAAKTSTRQADAADHPAGGQQASSSFAAHEQNTSTASTSQDPSTSSHHASSSSPRQREDSRGSSSSDSDESQRTRVQGPSNHRQESIQGPVTPGGTRLPPVTRHATGYFGEARAGNGVDVAKGEAAFQQLTRVLSSSPYDFNLEAHINLRKELLKRKGGVKDKYLGTTWENLTVIGRDSTGAFVKTLPDAVFRTIFAKDFIDFLMGRFPSLAKIVPGKKQKTRKLIQNFEGCVHQEMVRPSSFSSSSSKSCGQYGIS